MVSRRLLHGVHPTVIGLACHVRQSTWNLARYPHYNTIIMRGRACQCLCAGVRQYTSSAADLYLVDDGLCKSAIVM